MVYQSLRNSSAKIQQSLANINKNTKTIPTYGTSRLIIGKYYPVERIAVVDQYMAGPAAQTDVINPTYKCSQIVKKVCIF